MVQFMNVFLRLQDSKRKINFRALVAVTAPKVSNLSWSPEACIQLIKFVDVARLLSRHSLSPNPRAAASVGTRRLSPVCNRVKHCSLYFDHLGERRLKGCECVSKHHHLAGGHLVTIQPMHRVRKRLKRDCEPSWWQHKSAHSSSSPFGYRNHQ